MKKLSQALREILDEQNLTIYGAAQIVGAETDEPLKTVHDRISRFLIKEPKSWSDIKMTLTALGYEVRIVKTVKTK